LKNQAWLNSKKSQTKALVSIFEIFEAFRESLKKALFSHFNYIFITQLSNKLSETKIISDF